MIFFTFCEFWFNYLTDFDDLNAIQRRNELCLLLTLCRYVKLRCNSQKSFFLDSHHFPPAPRYVKFGINTLNPKHHFKIIPHFFPVTPSNSYLSIHQTIRKMFEFALRTLANAASYFACTICASCQLLFLKQL